MAGRSVNSSGITSEKTALRQFETSWGAPLRMTTANGGQKKLVANCETATVDNRPPQSARVEEAACRTQGVDLLLSMGRIKQPHDFTKSLT